MGKFDRMGNWIDEPPMDQRAIEVIAAEIHSSLGALIRRGMQRQPELLQYGGQVAMKAALAVSIGDADLAYEIVAGADGNQDRDDQEERPGPAGP